MIIQLAGWNGVAAVLIMMGAVRCGAVRCGAVRCGLWVLDPGVAVETVLPRLGARTPLGRLDTGPAFQLQPAHFVERHGLMLIIVLGESVLAIGIGISSGLEAIGISQVVLRRDRPRVRRFVVLGLLRHPRGQGRRARPGCGTGRAPAERRARVLRLCADRDAARRRSWSRNAAGSGSTEDSTEPAQERTDPSSHLDRQRPAARDPGDDGDGSNHWPADLDLGRYVETVPL